MADDFPIGGLWGKVLVVDVGTGEQRVEEPLDAEAAATSSAVAASAPTTSSSCCRGAPTRWRPRTR